MNNLENTPLHKAVVSKNVENVKNLVENKQKNIKQKQKQKQKQKINIDIDINQKNIFGQTPLHLVRSQNTRNFSEKEHQIYKLLIDNGASPFLSDNKGNIPFETNKFIRDYTSKKYFKLHS
jgi:ankyrin repeat protein